MAETLSLARPDDWHLHLRDGAALRVTVPATAQVFARAIVMPNLAQPVTTVAQAAAYRARILEAIPSGLTFEPLMTLYLTDRTTPDEIQRAADSPFVVAYKFYPSGATTNSAAGVTKLAALDDVFEMMQATGTPLLVHGEVTNPDIDVFDRERIFLERELEPLLKRFEILRVVFEHITTKEAASFVEESPADIAATITPQHLLMNRNDLFVGGVRPHNYCLPVLKRSEHQVALRKAATSGSPRFFLGTDSAPHARSAKESACGCAGCYTAPAALPLYAQVFEEMGALDQLEAFASQRGPDFYGLPRNTERIQLDRTKWTVPESLPFLANESIVPFWAGRELNWRVE